MILKKTKQYHDYSDDEHSSFLRSGMDYIKYYPPYFDMNNTDKYMIEIKHSIIMPSFTEDGYSMSFWEEYKDTFFQGTVVKFIYLDKLTKFKGPTYKIDNKRLECPKCYTIGHLRSNCTDTSWERNCSHCNKQGHNYQYCTVLENTSILDYCCYRDSYYLPGTNCKYKLEVRTDSDDDKDNNIDLEVDRDSYIECGLDPDDYQSTTSIKCGPTYKIPLKYRFKCLMMELKAKTAICAFCKGKHESRYCNI